MAGSEKWVSIPGYDGRYEASTSGRVRCLDAGKGDGKHIRILSPYVGCGGYLRLRLWCQGRSPQVGVHQLVAAAFVGPCPEGYEVNHKNFDKTDNRPENLEYLGHAENLQHARRHKSWAARGERAGAAKLTEAQVIAIRRSPLSLRELGTMYNVSSVSIHSIKSGKTWKHVKAPITPGVQLPLFV